MNPTVTLAQQLSAGQPVKFPEGANAVRAEAGTKTAVVLDKDIDTLKGVRVTMAVFGHVPNDSKGVPQRDKFIVKGVHIADTTGAAEPLPPKAAKDVVDTAAGGAEGPAHESDIRSKA